MPEGDQHAKIGYEFALETEARERAAELDRRFAAEELLALRVYCIRWNGNYLVEATFAPSVPGERVENARALLGEVGVAVHQDDLEDYKRATRGAGESLPGWLRRFFGG